MAEMALPGPRHSVSTPSLTTTHTPNKLSRRMRPPDLVIKANVDEKQPIRSADKQPRSAKRESRLGLRSLFGRHKPSLNSDNLLPQTTSVLNLDVQQRIGGINSEIHLPPAREDENRPRTATVKSPIRAAFSTSSPCSPTKRRGSLATWEPVPLFQAWPQALRSATLPACVQADHLLKQHNKKEKDPNSHAISHPDLGDDKGLFAEMAKKKHRRHSSGLNLDWTTKIYILVTSGYLLQYASEGTHDRLPEKVVQLCKDSAAFASDVIPGRHWVLQVSHIFEEGTAISQDTRSLLGKFGLREKEKRQASDILMVFEAAADMESWMALLRKEIETLGGKKPVTETGAPKKTEGQQQQPTPNGISPNVRTPVIRDPNRFGRQHSVPDMHLDASLGYLLPDHPFDNNSATNSFVSSDSRQLDRFSFVSAARTIVTSDSSACNSPIRDSFGSGSNSFSDDATAVADDNALEFSPEARLRPNASEIEDRRKSYRTSNVFLDPATSCVTHRAQLPQETPNFSLPNATARRRALSQSSTDGNIYNNSSSSTSSSRPPRRPRRPPPSALGFTRPLSIVADSPSPSKASSPRSPLETPFKIPEWPVDDVKAEYDLSSRTSSRGSIRTSFQVSIHNSPRKYASMNSLHQEDKQAVVEAAPPVLHITTDISRNICEGPSPRSRSPIQREMAAQKRASMYSLAGSVDKRASFLESADEFARGREPSPQPPSRSPYRRSLLSPGHARKGSGSSAKSFLSNRRSLPQMTHREREAVSQALLMVPCGPPAPPPNKALPPVPKGKKARSGSIPAKMGLRSVASLDGGVF